MSAEYHFNTVLSIKRNIILKFFFHYFAVVSYKKKGKTLSSGVLFSVGQHKTLIRALNRHASGSTTRVTGDVLF